MSNKKNTYKSINYTKKTLNKTSIKLFLIVLRISLKITRKKNTPVFNLKKALLKKKSTRKMITRFFNRMAFHCSMACTEMQNSQRNLMDDFYEQKLQR